MTTTNRVLLVEDDKKDALLAEDYFRAVFPHVAVTRATNMSEAYKEFKSGKFDLVLLDLNLPDGWGPSTVKEFKSFNRSVPIIVTTSIGSSLTETECRKFGAEHFLLKSQCFNEDFQAIVNTYV